jgi:hypothetical protein
VIGTPDEDRFPRLEVRLDETRLARTAFDVNRTLKTGSPAVYVHEGSLHQGVLVVHPLGLDDRSVAPLVARLRAVLTS